MKSVRSKLVTGIALLMVWIATSATAQSPDFDADIFFSGLSDNCELPCWNDLEMDVSSEQAFLDILEALEFESEILSTTVDGLSLGETLYAYHEQGEYGKEAYVRLKISGYVKDETIRRLEFVWNNIAVLAMPPQRVIEEFGPPDQVLVGVAGFSNFAVWLAYDDLYTYFIYLVGAHPGSDEICLDAALWVDQNRQPTLVVYVVAPELYGTNYATLRSTYQNYYVNYLEEVSDLTPEDFASVALEQSEPCLEIDGSRLLWGLVE